MILLADDSVTAQNMGKKILSDAGFEVITVSNGSAALKKILELKPDIAVLDVYMPGHSGLEVCKQLKTNPETANIPVLLTVGKLEPFKSDEALKARANAFIIKPFEASELLAVIKKIEDANPKPAAKPSQGKSESKTKKVSPLSRAFAANAVAETPDPEAEIQVTGWKNRISMPGKKKAAPEPEEDFSGVGTGFRDIAPISAQTSSLRRDSSFTADAVASRSPEPQLSKTDFTVTPVVATLPDASVAEAASAEPPLDITPDEIAAIKAAVAVLAGQGDNAPILHVAAAGIEGIEPSPRQLASEPEYSAEELADPQGLTRKIDGPAQATNEEVVAPLATAYAEEVAVSIPPEKESTQESAPEPATPTTPRWRAAVAELTPAEASVSLEQEMQASILATVTEMASHTHSLAEYLEPHIASPVDDEPVLSDVPAVAEPVNAKAIEATLEPSETAGLAVAAAASGTSNAVSNAMTATPSGENYASTEGPFTQNFAEIPALTSEASRVAASIPAQRNSTDFQDLRPLNPIPTDPTMEASAQAEGSLGAPSPVQTTISSNVEHSAPEDEIDSRTKAQMDAAWSNWHDIRNTIVTPQVSDQIAEVAEASAKEQTRTQVASEAASEASDIANMVDTMLAEMRPKLLEEIARKLAAKKE